MYIVQQWLKMISFTKIWNYNNCLKIVPECWPFKKKRWFSQIFRRELFHTVVHIGWFSVSLNILRDLHNLETKSVFRTINCAGVGCLADDTEISHEPKLQREASNPYWKWNAHMYTCTFKTHTRALSLPALSNRSAPSRTLPPTRKPWR